MRYRDAEEVLPLLPLQAAHRVRAEVAAGSAPGPHRRAGPAVWLAACAALISLTLLALTARNLLIGAQSARTAPRPGRPAAPERGPAFKGLHQVGLGAASVTLAWDAVPDGAPYTVYRDGERLGQTRTARFTDHGLSGPASFRYTVQDRFGRRQSLTAQVALSWAAVRALDGGSIALVTTYPSFGAAFTGRVVGGTGFVVSRSCDILTAYHVVRSAHLYIDVTLPGGSAAHARVLATDRGQDLALLAVPHAAACPAPLAFASQAASAGAPVGLFGHPGLGALAFAAGAVTGPAQPVDVSTLGTLQEFPFRASVDPGDSGGPLLNRWGRVVGVVDARSGGATGYAVPGSSAAAFVRRAGG